MVHYGFWPLSASNPQVGVACALLDELQCLTLEAQVSFKAFLGATALRNKTFPVSMLYFIWNKLEVIYSFSLGMNTYCSSYAV